jgi:hypothetical protein
VLGSNGSTLVVTSSYTVNDGNAGADYSVTTGDASGTITVAALTITAVTDSKTYNGTTTSSQMPTVAGTLYGGDTVTGLAQAFASKNVLGSHGSTLAVSAYTVNDGNGGADYSVTTSSGSGTITPTALTISAATDTKTYDGTTSSSQTPTVGTLYAGDTVTGRAQAFTCKDVLGTGGSTLVVSAYTVNDGDGGADYTVTPDDASGSITPAALTMTAVTDSKSYDGTTSSSQTPTVGTLYDGDSVTGLAQAFASKNVLGANGSTLVATSYFVNDGNSGADYTITTEHASGTITPAALTITAVTDTKTYNGTLGSAQIPTVGTLYGGDAVTGLAQSFASKNVLGANGSTLVATAYTVSDGNGGADYTVTTETANGTITPAVLTISAATDTKTYDGTTSSSQTPTVGTLYGGDTVTGLAQAFASKNVLGANGSTLVVTAYTVSDGNGGADYTVTTETANGTITLAALTITANNVNKTYGAGVPALTASYSGFVNTDTPASLTTPAVLTTTATLSSPVGPYPIVVSGATDPNYNITFDPGTLTINFASTSTTVVTSASPSQFGQSVTFTATVVIISPGAGTPTGNVKFYNGSVVPGNLLSTSGLSGVAPFSATFSTAALSVGNHSIIAVYQGDSDFLTSISSGLSQTVTKVSTSTMVTTSGSPTVYGQSVSFTGTVTGMNLGAPTGSVQFYDGPVASGNLLGTSPLSGSSPYTATYTTSSLTGGTHLIYAVYAGDNNFAISTSAPPATQVVNMLSTATAMNTSSNPSIVGQVIKFNAKVTTLDPSVGSPTGTVNFYDGGSTLIGSATVSGGIASYSTGSLTVGVHSITAVYLGNSNFAMSTSSICHQTVNIVTATTTVVSNRNPSTAGQSVTFAATVSGNVGTPTGTATFFADGTQIGTMQMLVSGQAIVTTSSLSAGIHSITVQYSGDRTYPASTGSLPGGQTVNTPGGVATTAVISNHNPSTNGQSVTFTATVSGNSGTPTGTVTFLTDGIQIGATQTLSSGQASISTSSLPTGSHTITVRYSGNNTYASNSSSLTGGQVVNPIPISTTTSVVSSLNPSLFGSSVTFTATVGTSGLGTPTGTIFFYDGTNLLGRVVLGGVVTYSTSLMTVGSHAITAVYSGDSNFAGSTSSVLTQVVNPSGGPNVRLAALTAQSSSGQRAKPNETVHVKRAVKAIPTGRSFFMKEKKGQLYLSLQRLGQH